MPACSHTDYSYGDMRVDFPDYATLREQIDVDPIPWGAYQVNCATKPTMVRQGLLDHVVEAEGSRDLVQRLGPRVQYLEFPTYGHTIQDYGACSTDTLVQFVNNPTELVDTTCITP